jgi:actin-like ATPase involved in cell morphogenesis/sugar lactone lactonase YvrE
MIAVQHHDPRTQGEGGIVYALGVDLGTTYSAAAVSRDGRVETASLGTTAPAIPSVVVLREDGQVLVGEAAERRATSEPARTAREFKRRLGDPTPIVVGSAPFGAEALMAHVLRAIVDQVSEREGERPSLIVITHPANYGPYKTDLLREAARLAGLDLGRVTFLSEPEAAAITYAGLQRVDTGDVVAVYDFGGGTFDAAVVRKTSDGFDLQGTPEGIERLGGIDIDAAVMSHVDGALGGALSRLDTSDPAVRAALLRLRDECRRAKEALSRDSDTVIPVSVPGLQTEVRLTRQELEGMVRPRIRETVEALQRAVVSAGVPMADVSRILLVGGTSRMPLIGEMVHDATGRPVALDAHPKYAIANGAAAYAATQGRTSAPAAAAAPGPPAPRAAPTRPLSSAAPVAVPDRRSRDSRPLILAGAAALLVAGAAAVFALGGGANRGSPAPTEAGASVLAGVASTAATPGTTASAAAAASASGSAPAATPGSSLSASGPGAGAVTLVAGIGSSNDPLVGEGGPPDSAALNLAGGLAVAPNGDIYIADTNTQRVLRIHDNILSVVYRGNSGRGENDVSGIAVDKGGRVYFTTGLAIRSVAADGSDPAIVSSAKPATGTGSARLTVGPDGSLYFATGRYTPRVYRVGSGGSLTVLAGTGAVATAVTGDGGPAKSAPFGRIGDIAVDSKGNLYIADSAFGVVRMVGSDGIIRTVAGGGSADPLTTDDPAVHLAATELKLPPQVGAALDATDRLYVAATLIGFIGQVSSTGEMEMIAGNGRSLEVGRPALETSIHQPWHIASTPSGDLLVLLEGGHLLWRIEGAAL